MTTEDRIRVNIYVTKEMHKWYMDEGKRLGLSMSQRMALALQQQMEQTTMIGLLPDMIDRLKQVEGEIDTFKGKVDSENE